MNQIWQIIKPLPDLLWRWFERIVVSLGGRTIAMLSVALLIAISSVIFSDNWIVSINRQIEVIKQVRDNIAVLHQLKANLFEAESAQRGYIITKRQEYVAPFDNALNEARANIKLSEILINKTSSKPDKILELAWLKDISANDLINDLKALGKNAFFAENRNDFIEMARPHFTDDCVVLLMAARDPSLEEFAKSVWEKL